MADEYVQRLVLDRGKRENNELLAQILNYCSYSDLAVGYEFVQDKVAVVLKGDEQQVMGFAMYLMLITGDPWAEEKFGAFQQELDRDVRSSVGRLKRKS